MDVDEQLNEFQSAVSKLTRLYQFRDREDAFAHDLSVSQAYLITILGEANQSLSMRELSSELKLDCSSTTRAVDVLVKREHVERCAATSDRRVVKVRLTRQGTAVHRRIRRAWVDLHRRVWKQIPARSRRAVVEALQLLSVEIARQRCN